MKSFKQYLREFTVKSTSDLVFKVGSQGSASSALKIPISGPMMKRIWPDTIRATVFHVTDHNGLGRIKKLEGRKKSISAFFSMMSRYMERGVATSGGAVVEMDADVLVSARDDIMSEVDKTGRRWVMMSWFENQTRGGTGPKFNKVERELNDLIRILVLKHLGPVLGDREVTREPEYYLWADMKKHLKGDGKKLRLVIKDYFDGVERIIRKNKEVMGDIFYSYVKSKRMTDNSWDEQIVNNIKIKKVHLIKPSRLKIDTSNPDHTHPIDSFQIAKETAEKLFDTVKVWDATETMDLEIYTRKVVAKEQPKRNIAY
jgi:hypothetical protein